MLVTNQPVRLRGPVWARAIGLVAGLFLFAAGIVLLLEARLGLSPWDVLHQGLARHTALSFGLANIVVGAVALLVAKLLGARIGPGTVANAVLVGGFVQALSRLHPIAQLARGPLALHVVLLAIGIALIGLGTALYISAGFGTGPRDSLMVVGAERSGLRIGAVRATLELCALGCGFGLGGTVGIGTLAFAAAIGPVVEASLGALRRSPLSVPAEHRTVPVRGRATNYEEAIQRA